MAKGARSELRNKFHSSRFHLTLDSRAPFGDPIEPIQLSLAHNEGTLKWKAK